jgi:hypothetical protein
MNEKIAKGELSLPIDCLLDFGVLMGTGMSRRPIRVCDRRLPVGMPNIITPLGLHSLS